MATTIHPKVKSGAFVAALVSALSVLFGLSPELQGALTTVLTFAAGYLTPGE